MKTRMLPWCPVIAGSATLCRPMADGPPLILAMVDPPGEVRSFYRWRLTHRSGDDAFGFAKRQDLAQHAADIALLALGWEEVAAEPPANALPSRFQIGDAVHAQLHGPCRVIGVHFARDRVRYYVQKMGEYDAGDCEAVDSAFVQPLLEGL